MTLDILQIGRGFLAARALVTATGKALDAGISERLLESLAKMTQGVAGNELMGLFDELGAAVSEQLGQDFALNAGREMVDVSNMAIEASARSAKAEAWMIKNVGKNFTRAGVESMVKAAAQAAADMLLKAGAELSEEGVRKAIISKLRAQIMRALLTDSVNTTLQIVRSTAKASELIASGVIEATAAVTRRQIEKLIAQQTFIGLIEEWTEEQKKTQQTRLQEAWRYGSEAVESSLTIIDDYGTVLAGIAVGRA